MSKHDLSWEEVTPGRRRGVCLRRRGLFSRAAVPTASNGVSRLQTRFQVLRAGVVATALSPSPGPTP